jgi:pimeloyl-ACP methyl ester carboxylesterase
MDHSLHAPSLGKGLRPSSPEFVCKSLVLMFRFIRFTAATLVLLVIASVHLVTAANNLPTPHRQTLESGPTAPLACDPDGMQDSGAVYRICMPAIWNGDLLVYAHGYVPPTKPVGIPEDQMTLPDGTSIADLANILGYAFATTSYSTNGLAVPQGIADLVDLMDIFTAEKGEPDKVYLVGVSEGGVITTLAVEQHPDVFDGGLAMCGPYGDFGAQINYFGDFRVVFDYFFPDLIPGSPVDIPNDLIERWESEYYKTIIEPAIENPANAIRVEQLLNVTNAPYDTQDPSTKKHTIERLLWYNVFATNDARAKLGGQPFDNQNRAYAGSNDDAQLNQRVQRFSAEQAALDEIAANYQTTGKLSVPLVTMHTTGDPVVPYWHAIRYRGKIIAADNIALHEPMKVDRYGHCTFEATHVLDAFGRLVAMVNNPPPYQPANRSFLPLMVRAGAYESGPSGRSQK